MSDITKFIKRLRKRKSSDVVFNPYRYKHLAENLESYLRLIDSEQSCNVMLVGEAPGFSGCKLTGIPFSSGQVIQNVDHPFLVKLRKEVNIKKIEGENTATIVWSYLAKRDIVPLFWNSFPFHPHPKNQTDKNRAPTKVEIEEGAEYLQLIYDIYKPQIIAGLGRAGESCLQRVFPNQDITYIRHPSRGGKLKFIEGLDSII